MDLAIENSGQPVDDAALDSFESHRGVTLPAAYRAFLRRHNGGRVTPSGFRVRGDSGSALVELFAIGSARLDEAWDVLKWPTSPELPPEYIPIGYCIAGDYLCLAVDGPQTGQVRLWNHEEGVDDGETPTAEMLYFVADDVDAFLASLR